MGRVFLIKFFAENKEIFVLWKYMAHSDDVIWLERLGDKLVRSLSLTDLPKNFHPITGKRVVDELSYLVDKDF